MLAKRILMLFFSDKNYIIGTVLNIIVVLVLFVAFLGEQAAINIQFLAGVDVVGLDALVVGMVFGGLLAVICVNSCMGVLQIMVADWKNAARDFHVSPISRGKIGLGYIFGSSAVGLLVGALAAALCLAYMMFLGGNIILLDIAKIALTALLSVLCATAMVYFVICCLKTPEAYDSFYGIISTLLGFMMGVFVPIGVFPEPIQWIVRVFPLSHAGAMFRSALVDRELAAAFAYADAEALDTFRFTFAVAFDYGVFTSDFWTSAAFLAASTVVFLILCVFMARRRSSHG